MINEHAAEGSFNRQHNETNAYLNDTGHKTHDLCEENAQTVPEAEQDAD